HRAAEGAGRAAGHPRRADPSGPRTRGMRLSAAARPLPGRAALWPAYDPEARGTGIVHLGLGAFARAHLAAYTEAALAEGGGDWRILGASLRGAAVAGALNPQDGRYTLIEKGAQTTGRVIGAVAGVLAGREISARLLAALADPACRIVSLTVTEKGYGIDRAARGADPAHPAVAADLAAPQAPQGVLGLLAEALRRRFAAGVPPF